MNKYYGGEPAAKGVYLNIGNFEFVRAEGETWVLPGDRNKRYIKVPGVAAVIAGPLAGLAFILFLPLVGIISLVTLIIYRGLKGVQWLGGKVLKGAPAKLADAHADTAPGDGHKNDKELYV